MRWKFHTAALSLKLALWLFDLGSVIELRDSATHSLQLHEKGATFREAEKRRYQNGQEHGAMSDKETILYPKGTLFGVGMIHSEHLVLHMILGAHYRNSSVDNSCLLLSYDGTKRSAQLYLMSNLPRLNS